MRQQSDLFPPEVGGDGREKGKGRKGGRSKPMGECRFKVDIVGALPYCCRVGAGAEGLRLPLMSVSTSYHSASVLYLIVAGVVEGGGKGGVGGCRARVLIACVCVLVFVCSLHHMRSSVFRPISSLIVVGAISVGGASFLPVDMKGGTGEGGKFTCPC